MKWATGSKGDIERGNNIFFSFLCVCVVPPTRILFEIHQQMFPLVGSGNSFRLPYVLFYENYDDYDYNTQMYNLAMTVVEKQTFQCSNGGQFIFIY